MPKICLLGALFGAYASLVLFACSDEKGRARNCAGEEASGAACAQPESPASDAGSATPEDAPDAALTERDGTTEHTGPDGATTSVEPVKGTSLYHRDIRPLIESHCVECHRQGGVGPFPFESYPQMRMAPEPRRRLDLGEPDLILRAEAPYTPPANADSYHCFLVGSVEQDTYLTALDIIPQIEAEVHHVQLHRVAAEYITAVRTLEEADTDPGYACSSSGVGSSAIPSQNMFSYRPGSLTVLFNEGDAAYLAQGSGLVLQVHYNTQFLPVGESPRPDATRVAMWTLPTGQQPDYVIYRTGVLSPLNGHGNGSILSVLGSTIPANASDVVGESSLRMRELSQISSGLLTFTGGTGAFIPGEIVGMTPHAHAWATRMKAEIRPGTEGEACLIDVPRWDYGWQLDYMFEQGVPYGPDDTLHVSCAYDNSAANQPVVNGSVRAPQTIRYGENTLDEMCLHYLWLRFKYGDFQAARRL